MSTQDNKNRKPGFGGDIPPAEQEPLYARIYAVVRLIPPGQVATYGQIAAIVGTCTARMVGYAMAACPDDVPWQRVVNAQSKVSPRADHWGTEVQPQLALDFGHRPATPRSEFNRFALELAAVCSSCRTHCHHCLHW